VGGGAPPEEGSHGLTLIGQFAGLEVHHSASTITSCGR